MELLQENKKGVRSSESSQRGFRFSERNKHGGNPFGNQRIVIRKLQIRMGPKNKQGGTTGYFSQ